MWHEGQLLFCYQAVNVLLSIKNSEPSETMPIAWQLPYETNTFIILINNLTLDMHLACISCLNV